MGSFPPANAHHLAVELRCSIYRKVKVRRALLWRRCIFVYVSQLNSSPGDIFKSNYARFSMRGPYESQLILPFCSVGTVWSPCILGNCLTVRGIKLCLAVLRTRSQLLAIQYLQSPISCWKFTGNEPSHKPPLFLSQQK